MCSGTQAAELGLSGQGVIAPGALADLVVLDRQLEVVTTYVGGVAAWAGRVQRHEEGEPPPCAGRLDQ